MANEKIFVGELGAKEMYRRLKGIIPSAWKDWSEQHDSVGTDGAIYIGQNNDLNRTWSFGFGNYNTASSTILADWSGSDVVMVGSYNNAIDAAGAYQIGFHNTVRNNHRMLIDAPTYNYYTAINFGNGNEIDAEGVNIGKHNTANHFSVNIGQHNSGEHAAVAIGEHNTANTSSAAIGKNAIAKANSIAIGNGNVVSGVKVVNGEVTNEEWGSSIAVGLWNLYAGGGSMAIGFGSSTAGKYSSVTEGAIGILLDNIGSASYQSDIKTGAIVVGQNIKAANNSLSFGRNNTVDGDSLTFGSNNSAYGNSISIGYSNSIDYYNAKYDLYDGKSIAGKSIAIGFGQSEIYSSGFAIGHSNTTIYGSGMCFGIRNIGVYSTAVAIGADNKNIYGDAYAIGAQNENITGNAVAIGRKNTNVSSAAAVVGSYNSANQGSFVIGYSNTVSLGSSAIGVANSGTGGVYLIGVGNTATASESDTLSADFHGNAAILGFGNTLKNIRAVWHSGDMSYGETKHTFSFVSGSYINAYGHNLIAIGHGHIVGDPTTWMTDSETNTKNDGFMTAIGYKCEALRNFDFAFGYKSMAKGGENVAIQHSTAIGYRNVAMVDSTVNSGIANFALCESILTSTASRNSVLHNFLFNSKQTWSDTSSSNVFLSTNGSFSGSDGLHRNIVSIGTNGNSLNIACGDYGSCTDNIMIGTRNGEVINSFNAKSPISITLNRNSMARNMLINNAYGTININYDFTDNKITNSELNVTATRFTSNIMHDSVLRCTKTGTSMVHNVLLSLSDMDLRQDCTEAYHNFLFLSHLGDSASGSSLPRYSSANSNNNNMSQNFLVGTTAYHTQGCVSFSVPSSDDGPYKALTNYTDGKDSAFLNDCGRVVNFGDNKIQYASLGFVYGAGNKLSFTNQSVVFGNENEIAQISGTSTSTKIGDVHIFGAYNNVKFNNESGNLFTFGAHNNHTVGPCSTSNFIYGDYNSIGEYVSAESRKMTPTQINNIQTASPGTIFIPTEQCISVSGERRSDISNNTVYFVDGTLFATPDSTDDYAGTTVTNMAGDDLYFAIYNGTLPKGFYKSTSYYSNSSYSLSTGKFVTPGKAYCKYKSGTQYSTYLMKGGVGSVYNRATSEAVVAGCYTDQPASYTSMNMIFGRNNAINSRVVGYSVMGQVNRVTYTDTAPTTDFAISNGFVQGNNNVALNGSNIIAMGNGNVSTGHNSVAIGSQLISNQWQTVIGKYNVAIAGPNRLSTQTPQDPTKALFIVGNGYSSDDSLNWQNETYITRSNALELYADGRLKVSGNIEATNIPAAPVENGQYTLNCTVNNGTVTYNWVKVEFTTVS